eukprot:4981727-Pyramimonas_sp.AAC.1
MPLAEVAAARPGILDSLMDPHLADAAAQTLQHTWFQVKGCPLIAKSLSGSRPGMVLADFLFNL